MNTTLRVLTYMLLASGFLVPAYAAGLPATAALAARAPAVPRWQQQAEIIATDGAAGDHLGGPVALSGSTALVGAWDKNNSTGAAYIFVRHGTQWTEQAKLTARDGASGDHFGTSVALSGGTALIGAPGKNDSTGAVYIFVRTGGRWIQQARLSPHDPAVKDWFGRAVALSGDTALVGAWYKNNGTGAAYVFTRGEGRWTEQAKLTARDGAPEDYFGTAVALSGDTALIGAGFKNRDTGAAYVFVRHGTRWSQQARLIAGDARMGDTFGTSAALSGNTALVGAEFAHGNTGAAYIFVRNGTRWTQQARLIANDGAVKDWFGRNVALSDDSVLIGAWCKNSDTGAAYVFAREGSRWTQQARLIAGDAVAGDHFGSAVALSNGTALIGAGFKHNATGAVYVFSTTW